MTKFFEATEFAEAEAFAKSESLRTGQRRHIHAITLYAVVDGKVVATVVRLSVNDNYGTSVVVSYRDGYQLQR